VPDKFNVPVDAELSLGIVLHHFTVVSENWAGQLSWRFAPEGPALPVGHRAVASASI
jgi:hypothetical protein